MVPINPRLLYLQIKRVREIQEKHNSVDPSDFPPLTWKDDKWFLIGLSIYALFFISLIGGILFFLH